MKFILVILVALVGLHTTAAVVEVISPVIEHSSVPGVADRIRYVRHIQYGGAASLGSSHGYRAERMKRQDADLETVTEKDLTELDSAPDPDDVDNSGLQTRTEHDMAGISARNSPAQYVAIQAVLSLYASSGGSGGRKRRSPLGQLPPNVIHAIPQARVPGFEGRVGLAETRQWDA